MPGLSLPLWLTQAFQASPRPSRDFQGFVQWNLKMHCWHLARRDELFLVLFGFMKIPSYHRMLWTSARTCAMIRVCWLESMSKKDSKHRLDQLNTAQPQIGVWRVKLHVLRFQCWLRLINLFAYYISYRLILLPKGFLLSIVLLWHCSVLRHLHSTAPLPMLPL